MDKLERDVLRIRLVEEELSRRYGELEMRCPVHLSLGQEHIAVGVCAGVPKDSLMVSTHRSHAHYLAKGGDLKRMIAELYGKEAGCSRGMGGSMHLVDWSCGFAGSTSIVAGTIPVGVGLAFADKLRGSSRITAIMIGDAAIEEGVFHESANFAALHNLNILFVLEDNDRSCYTKKVERQPDRPFAHVAEAHHLDYEYDPGNTDPATIASSIRELKLPGLYAIRTKSLVEHCGPKVDDGYNYITDALASSDADVASIASEIEEAFRWSKSVS